MKLISLRVFEAATCGGLLDGLELDFHADDAERAFSAMCLVGPNGSGKSQLLQVLAEVFQSIAATVVSEEERKDGNPDLRFEIIYQLQSDGAQTIVRASRRDARGVVLEREIGEDEWEPSGLDDPSTRSLVPSRIVGYTSGGNETLSLPFLLSRFHYAEAVYKEALGKQDDESKVEDTRLLLIDYGTHLEVLVSNLLLGDAPLREALLTDSPAEDLHSFRCVVQLSLPGSSRPVALTDELQNYLDRLRQCATCYEHDAKRQRWVFDFFVDDAMRQAFATLWPEGAFSLYTSVHKLAMLNDLGISKSIREAFKRETKERRFHSTLPEPPDENKVFRFERVLFRSRDQGKTVDYVSLSDGEHQFVQVMGIFAMLADPNVLFLLDEPESHFNPKWRVDFVKNLLELPTTRGRRSEGAIHQDCLLTTHAPFVISDTSRDSVLIFDKHEGRIRVTRPRIETFGSTFDAILADCFAVQPPISQLSRDLIEELLASRDVADIEERMGQLGSSVDRALVADHLRQLERERGGG
ncbi:restriction system-associated AAA family ATPase [Enhygromyxa salina]|uniref:restriction system-associated AAA family ATPase n=1 Tax=Enhygromyxa salina TaxID=215803 RepID=UPI000D089374|nr:restriction system-associated AAA family ATPase [Enhygromyxa salina]